MTKKELEQENHNLENELEFLKEINIELTESLRRCHWIMGIKSGPPFLDVIECKGVKKMGFGVDYANKGIPPHNID